MARSTRARRARVWLLVGGVLFASGCAAISGLDQYVKGDVDASLDAVADMTTNDVVAEGAPPSDSGNDANDAGGDAVVEDAASDAADASDTGCGALNTVDNCSSCGAACDASSASAVSCTGTTCQYTCKPGFSNCNTTAPDLGGCECATPSCCGSSCATTHTNGVGESYWDCVDAGTYDQTQAGKACTAYTNAQFACSPASCVGDAGDLVICGSPDGGACGCWDYTGTDKGYVFKSNSPEAGCFCPNTTDSIWN